MVVLDKNRYEYRALTCKMKKPQGRLFYNVEGFEKIELGLDFELDTD